MSKSLKKVYLSKITISLFNLAKLDFKSKINFKNPKERNTILGDRKIEGDGTGNDSERLAVNSCSIKPSIYKLIKRINPDFKKQQERLIFD